MTGQIAALLDGDAARRMTVQDIASAIKYAGSTHSLRTLLDKMASDGKITRGGAGHGGAWYSSTPSDIDDLRAWNEKRS